MTWDWILIAIENNEKKTFFFLIKILHKLITETYSVKFKETHPKKNSHMHTVKFTEVDLGLDFHTFPAKMSVIF